MNNKELAEHLSKWLPELVAGKTLEYAPGRADSWYRIKTVFTLTEMIEDHREIRIKQTPIPDPPEGEEWQNPDNLTAEQIEIDDGWRLLLKSEVHEDKRKSVGQIWTAGKSWHSYGCGACKTVTYRTKADESPVGSLKPKSETELLAEKLDDIADYLTERGYGHITMKLVAAELGSGKVPWVELK